MACNECGRVGRCETCCCISPDHGHQNITTCRLCEHQTDRAREGA